MHKELHRPTSIQILLGGQQSRNQTTFNLIYLHLCSAQTTWPLFIIFIVLFPSSIPRPLHIMCNSIPDLLPTTKVRLTISGHRTPLSHSKVQKLPCNYYTQSDTTTTLPSHFILTKPAICRPYKIYWQQAA